MFEQWDWEKFGRSILAGLLAGVIGGALLELLIPSIGTLKAATVGGLVGAITAAVNYLVEEA